MLDELCHDYHYERKYAIKLLRGKLPAPSGRKKPGPSRQYAAIEPVVRTIWLAAEQPCGKRLAPALELWLPHYERHHGRLGSRQRELLKSVSSATLDRLLAPARAEHPLRGLSGTKPGSLLRTEIPIRTDNWDIQRPGFLEADTVAHCGHSLAGDFIWSTMFTDIYSAWTEGRAVWNKGAAGVVAAVQSVEAQLPFELLGFDSDNGSEFLNYHLRDHFALRVKPVGFTRSRPYHKDDNAHIEQKNWMWPRQLLGYGRLERAELVGPINELYQEAWGPLMNFFLPSLKLKRKWREQSHWRKRYESAQTAYQRLANYPGLTRRQRRELRDRFESLDPFKLKQEVERRLKPILAAAEIASSPSGGSAPQ
ncbi:MAG TPA: hypothetical protein VMI06_05970 [Terriglobia bacterium]|nr:hypothetical protein [Terriglobia bacterium]